MSARPLQHGALLRPLPQRGRAGAVGERRAPFCYGAAGGGGRRWAAFPGAAGGGRGGGEERGMGLRGDCGPGGARRTPWRRARVGKVSAGSGCSRGAWREVPEERPTRRLRRPCSVPVRGLRVRRARGSAVPWLRVKAAGPALPTGCRCRLCPADPRTDGQTDGRTWPGAAPGRAPRRDPAGCGPAPGAAHCWGPGKPLCARSCPQSPVLPGGSPSCPP